MKNLSHNLIRFAAAGNMIIHGVTRLVLNTSNGFGDYLESEGFPMGRVIAWSITIFEIVGGSFLLANKFSRVISMIFVFQLTMGIWLVHRPEGWFVVGAGRNGMEYSVLLIVCFVSIFFATSKNKS